MRSLRLVGKVRRKKRYSSYTGDQGRVTPNVLSREFESDGPNQQWVTDVTESSVGGQKLCLSPIMDLFDRQIIAYSVGLSPNLELTNTSLVEGGASVAGVPDVDVHPLSRARRHRPADAEVVPVPGRGHDLIDSAGVIPGLMTPVGWPGLASAACGAKTVTAARAAAAADALRTLLTVFLLLADRFRSGRDRNTCPNCPNTPKPRLGTKVTGAPRDDASRRCLRMLGAVRFPASALLQCQS